ncbi:MFS transporter [Paenibacillus tuaregi]|uniref:MFS transporter n=1 Tax=Paenibacillus tuaregi TaxID=1816681 RepID=UPI00083936CD|nr:MFS transporter [Paenibacillus tuaregi]
MTLWLNKQFLILLISGGILAVGNKIYELALPLILYDLTHSSVAMSVMRGIDFLPNLLLAAFIGVWVDRARKKLWSVFSVLVQLILLTTLYFWTAYGSPSIYVFYITGFLLMTLGYAYSNARVALVKLVLPGQHLTPANAAFSFLGTAIAIMGPALTGLILMLSDLNAGLLLTAIAFVPACLLILLLPADPEPSTVPRGNFRQELKEGWNELLRNRILKQITVLVIFLNSTTGMVDATIVFAAKDGLRLDNAALGLVLSAGGIGGLAGSLLISPLRCRFSIGHILGVTTLLSGLAYAVLYFAHNGLILATGLFFDGMFGTISSICIWTYRQESTPQHLIGRVSGITGSAFKLGMPFAILAAGWISQHYSPALVFGTAALLNIVMFIACRMSSLWSPRFTEELRISAH